MNTGNVEVAINRIISVQSSKFKSNLKAVGSSQTRNMSTVSNSLALTSEEYRRCGTLDVVHSYFYYFKLVYYDRIAISIITILKKDSQLWAVEF